MKTQLIKKSLIFLALYIASIKINAADINLCMDTFSNPGVLSAAEQNMSKKDLLVGCLEFGGLVVGGIVLTGGLLNYLNARGVANPTLSIKNYTTVAQDYINKNKLSMSPQDLDTGASLQVANQINTDSDTELGYSSGTTEAFMQRVMSGGSYTDALSFVSSSIDTLSTTMVGSTKITLPNSYKNFTDYIIKNNITDSSQLTDLITQASSRANGGLLPETYEPSVPSGPSGPVEPVAPKVPGNNLYDILQNAVAASKAQMPDMIQEYLGGSSSTLMNYRTLLIQEYQAASEQEKEQAQEDIDNYNAEIKAAGINDPAATIEPTDL